MSVDHEVNVVIFQSVDRCLKLVMVMALSEKKVRDIPQELNKFRLYSKQTDSASRNKSSVWH